MHALVDRWKGQLRKDLRTLRVVRANVGEGASAWRIVGVRFPPQLVDELVAAADAIANPPPTMIPARSVTVTLPDVWVPGEPLDIKLSRDDARAHRFFPGAHMQPGMAFSCTIPARPAPVSAPAVRANGSASDVDARVATEAVTPVDSKAMAAAMTEPKTIASWFTAPARGDAAGAPSSSLANAESADAAFARRLQAQEVALRGKRQPRKPPSKRLKRSTEAAGKRRSGQLSVIDLTSSPAPGSKGTTKVGEQQSMLSFFGKRRQ
jgi:hypothetical protein